LKFHPKHVTNKNKTKHIMKISHINVNIYDKTVQSILIRLQLLRYLRGCDESGKMLIIISFRIDDRY
jgi:hypothetical protein